MFSTKDAPKSGKDSQYKLVFNSSDWLSRKDDRSDFVWENKKDGRILLSNSFCEEFQDQPLDKLANKTFRTIDEFKSIKGEFTTFHHREAYQLHGHGKVDGVPVVVRLLNTRRNNCYFDFVSISPSDSQVKNDPDFQNFLKSVEFK